MIVIEDLERKLNLIRREHGLIGGRLRVTPLQNHKTRIEAAISLKHFNVEFQIDPQTDEIWQSQAPIQVYARRTNLDDIVGSVCKRVIEHEIWHWKNDEISGEIGCPTDLFNAAKIADAVYSALDKKGILKKISNQKAKEGFVNKLRNLFEDVVVNSNLAYEESSDGLSIVYYDSGINEKGYQLFAEGFFKLQMNIWGNKHDKELLGTFYTNDQKRSKKIETVVERTLKAMDLQDKSLDEVIPIFRNPKNWPDLAYKMITHMSDLIEDPEKGKGGLGVASISQHEESDEQGSSEEQDSQDDKEEGSSQAQQSQEEDDKDKKNKNLAPQIVESIDSQFTPDAERQIVITYHAHEAGPPRFMPLNRVLKIAYESFAGEVKIQAKIPKEGFQMPIAPITHQNFDPLEHDIQEIDFSQALFDPESVFPKGVNFSVARDNYSVLTPYTKKKERLPNIMFLFDCSGTMND